ncbi:hypothetical protein PspLS_10205 [Pyricularia sp. CBS 133598]|nr:hypothetical protein PspLS_10205 [Pyricularia sp. CBS 133598]
MATMPSAPVTAAAAASRSKSAAAPAKPRSAVRQVLSLPPRLLHMYDDFIIKNASQVSQIESALRSLTYVIPGRFRDAEIASESLHSGVGLLSLYHDLVLQQRAASPSSPKLQQQPTSARPAHTRYTTFWFQKSPIYRRVALALQVVQYTQLLLEMAAKRRGDERLRWRVVVLVEAFKAFCKLVLLRITRGRPLLSPPVPERQVLPEENEDDLDGVPPELGDEHGDGQHVNGVLVNGNGNGAAKTNGHAHTNGKTIANPSSPQKEWFMPRTQATLPSLPSNSDIGSYLLSRVLTADDIKPAPKLLRPLSGAARAAEVLHILAPLVYALTLAHFSLRAAEKGASGKKKNGAATWTPWLLGVALSLAARQLRDRGFGASALEREEWDRRGWGVGWWAMRGAAYEHVVKGMVEGVRRRMPSFVGGVLEDYEYLWDNYYFSTAD